MSATLGLCSSGRLASGVGSPMFGTPGLSPSTASLFGDVSGIAALPVAVTPGLFSTCSTSLRGGSTLTLGGALAGIGGGFALGNLLLRSEEFDHASWTRTSCAVTANAGVAPDGDNSVAAWFDLLAGNAGTSTSGGGSCTFSAKRIGLHGSVWRRCTLTVTSFEVTLPCRT